MKKFKGVIFDMDGTLVDSESYYNQMIVDLFAEHGQKISSEAVATQIGIPDAIAEKFFYQYWHCSTFEDFHEIYQRRRYESVADYGKIIFPGVYEVFQFCKERGIKTAIASASPLSAIEKMAADCNLVDLVDVLLSGENLPNNKPAPDIYLAALKKLGLPAKDCLAVEDSTAGVAAAKSAGLMTIAKRHPIFKIDLSRADHIIDDLTELEKYLT